MNEHLQTLKKLRLKDCSKVYIKYLKNSFADYNLVYDIYKNSREMKTMKIWPVKHHCIYRTVQVEEESEQIDT